MERQTRPPHKMSYLTRPKLQDDVTLAQESLPHVHTFWKFRSISPQLPQGRPGSGAGLKISTAATDWRKIDKS